MISFNNQFYDKLLVDTIPNTSDICTYEEYMPQHHYIVPIAHKKFCLTNRHSLLDGRQHDIDTDALARACSQIPFHAVNIEQLTELEHPELSKDNQTLHWTLFQKSRLDNALPYYAAGHYHIFYQRSQKLFTVKLFWNESLNIKHAFQTRAAGFTSQKDVIQFLRDARAWGITSWLNQQAVNKAAEESYNLTQKQLVTSILAELE